MTDHDRAVATRYDYEFRLWPVSVGHRSPIFDVFEMYPRVVLTKTEAEFAVLDAALAQAGFTLREVTRVPYHMPEIVP